MSSMRLNKFLAEAGLCSRRQADEYIAAGDVYVNGQPACLGMKINPNQDQIVFQNKLVTLPPDQFVYYALYKPRGIISTSSDEWGRAAVTDLVPPEPRVYPVGRLDKDSEGLMILTNDGELTYELTHPKFEHQKEYQVVVKPTDDSLQPEQIKAAFQRGISIDGQHMAADSVQFADKCTSDDQLLTMHIILHTGYKRQIRRMCAAVGLEVISLKRIGMGKLQLGSLGLAAGQYVRIERNDICG